jgi:hypothetical protein
MSNEQRKVRRGVRSDRRGLCYLLIVTWLLRFLGNCGIKEDSLRAKKDKAEMLMKRKHINQFYAPPAGTARNAAPDYVMHC